MIKATTSWASARKYYLQGLILLLPLIVYPYYHDRYEIPKVVFLWVSIYILTFTALLLDKSFLKSVIALKNETIIKLFLSYAVVATISTTLYGHFSSGFIGSHFRFDGLLTLYSLFGLLVIALIVVKDFGYRTLLSPLIASAYLLSTLGILHWLFTVFGYLPKELLYDGRITATLGQSNFLGGIIVFVLPLIRHKRQSLEIIGKLILLSAIFLTFSKASYLALLVIFVHWIWSKRRTLFILTSTIIAMTLMVLESLGVLYYIHKYFMLNQHYQLQRLTFWWTKESLGSALHPYLFKVATSAIHNSPLLGYGKGSIPAIFNAYSTDIEQLYRYAVDSSHNLFLDITLESGLVGLTIFSSLVLFILIKAFSISNKLGYSITSFIVWNLFNNISITQWVYFIIIAAIIVSQKGTAIDTRASIMKQYTKLCELLLKPIRRCNWQRFWLLWERYR